MSSGLLDFFAALNLPSLTDFLNPSSYDELLELDVPGDSFRYLYNVEGKYDVPVTQGRLSDYIAHLLAGHVHPDDAEAFHSMADMSTLFERMEVSRVPGALDLVFRLKTPEGKWRWAEMFLVGTARHGLPEGKVYCYVYDIQGPRGGRQPCGREQLYARQPDRPAHSKGFPRYGGTHAPRRQKDLADGRHRRGKL